MLDAFGNRTATAAALALFIRDGAKLGEDAERGRLLLRQFGCGSRDSIPGRGRGDRPGAPPLAGIGSRAYLGGVLPNTPANMAGLIRAIGEARKVQRANSFPVSCG